jgi:endonuclease/exonuclease/phosphatase (EEP) superfamily protein YafD
MGVVIRVIAWVCFLVAATLTALRFLQLENPLAQVTIGYVPWAIPLYAMALLLFLYHVFFPGKSRWQVTMALAGLALAGLVLQAWWVSPLFLGDRPEAGPGAAELRVLTLNLDAGTADPNEVVATAVTSSADVLVLQEVVPATLDRMDQAGLGDAFPHRAGLPLANGQYGTMVFSTATLGDVTFLGTSQSSVQLRVSLPQGSVWMFGVGVHAPDDRTPDTWLDDLRQLTDIARTLHPAIVAGDFEATFDHAPFRDLLDTGLDDAGERANAGWQPTWPVETSYLGISVPRLTQPDHVLIGSMLTAVSQISVRVPGTDHRGVLAKLASR